MNTYLFQLPYYFSINTVKLRQKRELIQSRISRKQVIWLCHTLPLNIHSASVSLSLQNLHQMTFQVTFNYEILLFQVQIKPSNCTNWYLSTCLSPFLAKDINIQVRQKFIHLKVFNSREGREKAGKRLVYRKRQGKKGVSDLRI